MRNSRQSRTVIEVPGWMVTPETTFIEVPIMIPPDAVSLHIHGNVECPPIPGATRQSWQLFRLFQARPGRRDDRVLYELQLRTRHRRWIENKLGELKKHDIAPSVSQAGPETGVTVQLSDIREHRGTTLYLHLGMEQRWEDGYRLAPRGAVYQATQIVIVGEESMAAPEPVEPEPEADLGAEEQVADLALNLAALARHLEDGSLTREVIRKVAPMLGQALMVDQLRGRLSQESAGLREVA